MTEFTCVAKIGDVDEGEMAAFDVSGQVLNPPATEPAPVFPWPGPGNSEGPVDPDPWSVQSGGLEDADGALVGERTSIGSKRRRSLRRRAGDGES